LSYIFDNSVNTNFGAVNPATALLTDPRFTGVNTLPLQNVAPVITRPSTPDPYGLASSTFNYAIAQNFKIPYSYQWNFGMQRELPGNMLLDVSYVGRRGKRLFAQSDVSQIVDFRDPASGQYMLAAFNNLQSELTGGGAITAQPWLENQVGPLVAANYGTSCAGLGAFIELDVANCTEFVAGFVPSLVEVGGSADLVATLFTFGLLDSNVGLHRQFAVNAYITNQGYSSYDGLLVSLRKRFSQGFQFDANYTWSHAIDNQSSVTNAVSEGLIYNSLNLQAGRGNADFDVRHLFNANAIWELPLGRGRAYGSDANWFVDGLIGGWSIAGIFTARSGLPFTMFSGSWPVTVFTADNAGVPTVFTGSSTDFAVDIRDDGEGIQYFADPEAVQAAFRYPRHGEVGNRNLFRGPSYWNIDAVISKRFRLPWEGHLLTFRAEAYNLTNSNHFGPPDLTFHSGDFGRITTVQSAPRVIQFGLRYDF
jgi:hypothetical protein